MEESFLTPDEVSKILKVNPATIYRWVREGLIPHILLGHRTVRFRAREISELKTIPNGNGKKKK